ncbi:MAG TPA: chemotaxis protein CheW [Acidobacteriaceae bacterium]|nr:chemotaxis protein CheW [Acidobacteriaceae bacterium]
MVSADGMDDIVKEFIVESTENLDQLDRDLISLEKNPTSKELLGSIFRAVHTVKGTTGFLGYTHLESVAHVGENLLSRLREGALALSPPITSGLLAMVDAVRTMLASIEKTGSDGDSDYAPLIEILTQLQAQEPDSKSQDSQATNTSTICAAEQEKPQATIVPDIAEEDRDEPLPLGQILVEGGQVKADQLASVLNQQREGDPRRVGEILVARGMVHPEEVLEALQVQTEGATSNLSSNNIRVDVGQLDKLMNLVGELVLARNQILQFSTTQQDSTFLNTTQRLSLITTELQEGVMKTRMQPIENVWGKFPRLVRDLALACGKRVQVEMEGKDTELDKTILEAIKDPLTHLIRNAVDHGIECPSQREAAGKSVEGRLFLRAYHEGGQVNIEISDDGAGIDLVAVKSKAVERGLIPQEQAARISEREAYQLIFLPGFSTAQKVTNVSGRGVGMDVVKTNIEKIGGMVDLQSAAGLGTTVKIKIPLTLAIIPALIVTCGGERYAIPQVSLLELVRLEGNGARHGIESVHGAPVYRLRGNLLSLVYLNRELHFDSAAAQNSAQQDVVNIAVLQADDCQFGLIVDEVNDTEEIVVKPLGELLKGLSVYTGATIMGDGRVALILDVLGLAQHAGVISEVRQRKISEDITSAAERAQERKTLLLFQSPDDGRMAIFLSDVTRLETFSRSSIERTGKQQVVQYRGTILPLVHVSSLLEEHRLQPRGPSPETDDKVQVIVHTQNRRSVGLVVERILDIVEDDLATRRPVSREGVLGSFVVQGKVTEILDVDGIIRVQDPTFFEPEQLLTGVAS